MWNWFRLGKFSGIYLTAQMVPQTQRPDHWHEERRVFIYSRTFLHVSQLADIVERADGDRYI